MPPLVALGQGERGQAGPDSRRHSAPRQRALVFRGKTPEHEKSGVSPQAALSRCPVLGPPHRSSRRRGGARSSQSRHPVWLHISRLTSAPPSSNLDSDVMVLTFQNLLPSEQGLVQGQGGRGEGTGYGAPRVKHARLHFDQDKRAIM